MDITQEELDAKVNEALDNYKKENPPMDIQSASNMIQNAGGKVFLNDESLDNFVKEKTSYVRSQALNPVDKVIKETFGIDKVNEHEKTKDFLLRGFTEWSKKKGGEGIDEAEFNALKTNLSEALGEIETYKGKIEGYEKDKLNGELSSLRGEGIPINDLDYSETEMKVFMPGLNAMIDAEFDFQKDERGWKGINRRTGEVVLEGENRKEIPKIVNDFVKGLENIKFKVPEYKGSRAPNGTGSANLTDADKQRIQEELDKFQKENPDSGSGRSYWEKARSLGADIPVKIQKQFFSDAG